jgi:hypothetical protein
MRIDGHREKPRTKRWSRPPSRSFARGHPVLVRVGTVEDFTIRQFGPAQTGVSEEETVGKHEEQKPKPDPSQNGQGKGPPPKEPPPGKHGKK